MLSRYTPSPRTARSAQLSSPSPTLPVSSSSASVLCRRFASPRPTERPTPTTPPWTRVGRFRDWRARINLGCSAPLGSQLRCSRRAALQLQRHNDRPTGPARLSFVVQAARPRATVRHSNGDGDCHLDGVEKRPDGIGTGLARLCHLGLVWSWPQSQLASSVAWQRAAPSVTESYSVCVSGAASRPPVHQRRGRDMASAEHTFLGRARGRGAVAMDRKPDPSRRSAGHIDHDGSSRMERDRRQAVPEGCLSPVLRGLRDLD